MHASRAEVTHRYVVATVAMDATSRNLVRRAKARRSHERHARATRVRRRQEERRREREGGEDGESTVTQSTIPNLPSLAGSQYLTVRSCGDGNSSNRHHRRHLSEDCVSDSNVSTQVPDGREEKYHSDHFSDTALCVRQWKEGRKTRKRQRGGMQLLSKEPALPVIPSSPPSPTLSRMVCQKTEGLQLSDTVLQEIKEMSSHLRIVSWLWDSQRVSLRGGSQRPSTPGTTSCSGNLVIVRRSAGNWFDLPRLVVPREELASPVSVNSELKSDYEDELMQLT